MKKMRIAFLALALVFSLSIFPAFAEASQPLKVVCTIFPQYDFVFQILGERAQDAEVTLLLDSGVDLHSYSPTAEDIAQIAESDLFIYVGGESDSWVSQVFASLGERAPQAVALTDLVDTLPEEIVEGMEHEHEREALQILDRPLSDWEGSWQSVLPHVQAGTLEKFLTAKAEERGQTVSQVRDTYLGQYDTPYQGLEIDGEGVRFASENGSIQAQYAYAGYRRLESDHGVSVWYVFESAQEGEAPKYIAFNDHGTGGEEEEHEDEHEGEEEEHGHGAAHFHMRYGNEGPDALAQMEGWAPTFFEAQADAAEIDEVLSGHGHGHEHEEEDEHVWLSLKSSTKIVRGIEEALSGLRPENAKAYRANANAYIEELFDLDARYRQTVDGAARKTVLFADRFPFRYLAEDYGLTYYAAFSGCSAETEASFETVAFLADKVGEFELPAVLVIEGAAHKIAETVVANSEVKDAQILTLNSLQSVTAKDVEEGASYLATMEANLAVLEKALN